MKTEIYSCDICGDQLEPLKLIGLRFSNMRDFKLSDARSTDGKHLCFVCAIQLSAQLPDYLDSTAVP